jgi:hypothetical protein
MTVHREAAIQGRALAARLAEMRRADRATVTQFVRAIEGDDRNAVAGMLESLDTTGLWKPVMRKIATLFHVPPGMRRTWRSLWRHSGDHIRGEVGDDLLLIAALGKLLRPYRGPSLTLYRGELSDNRRRRTYGLSWSLSIDVADGFASSPGRRQADGGSVLLRAVVQPEAIICMIPKTDDIYGEAECLVDRRLLTRVDVLRRYPQAG